MKTKKIKFNLESDFGAFPNSNSQTFRKRLDSVAGAAQAKNLDIILVFADREHSATMEFLTGVAPRFEEGLLAIKNDGSSVIYLGNECQYFAPDSSLGIDLRLFQDFSPMGQPRNKPLSLKKMFNDLGISQGSKVGCVGYKSYREGFVENALNALDLPSYLVDELRETVGSTGAVVSAIDIFVNPVSGLRVICDAEQIAQFEFAARVVSNSIQAAIRNISIDSKERSIEKHLESNGLPLSCHRMVSFGDKVRRGLASPSDNTSKLGDPFTLALGISGALTARAGMVANGIQDLDSEIASFYEKFSYNYFQAIATWYSNVKIGITGGELFAAVDNVIDKSLYELMLNPGHNLHLEEWFISFIEQGNDHILQSGMVLQSDLIPVSKGPFCYSNAEDGIALADSQLRQQIQTEYPDLWKRIQQRQDLISNQIGIKLDESVLPLSDSCGYYAPFALNPDEVFVL